MVFKQVNLSPYYLKIIALALGMLVLTGSSLFAAENVESEEFSPGDLIMHHVQDAHEWHFFDGATLYLPVILYSKDRGLEVFSSANFYEHHEPVEYNGYRLDHGHIVPVDESRSVMDFSITKNVAALFMGVAIMLILFISIANRYKKDPKRAPKGLQSLFEPIIIFIRDDIAKLGIGPKYKRYLPFLLTLFFFIWFGNLFGLIPGAANLTGNIAVTMTLALFTLILTVFSGNKYYWGHIFNTPGVPKWLLPIMVPVEIMGIFTKPFSLMLRLFVAITAGHIVILSLLGLIFIFQSYTIGVVSTIFVTIINFIELLVATIQAYVFTLFSAMYIGAAVAEHHHEEGGEEMDKALI